MSIEYFAECQLSQNDRTSLCEALPNDQYALASHPTEERIRLRFSAYIERDEWPEYIDICFGESIRVAVHTGTATERRQFLQYFESLMHSLGHECQFVED